MRIAEDGPARLVLRDRTSWISWLCWMGALVTAADAAEKRDALGLILPGLCVLFGVLAFRNSTVVFDKMARLCRLKRRDMWRLTTKDVPFDAIEDVHVQPLSSDTRTGTTYRLSLLTTDGEIPLSSSYQPGHDRFEQMRASIVRFISKDASALPSADPAIALVRAGRQIDAIALLRRRDGLSLTEAKRKVDAMGNGA